MNNYKLIIFDFDLTLCRNNLFKKYGNDLNTYLKDINELGLNDFNLQNFPDFIQMKQLLSSLVKHHNCIIGIVSFGFQSMIWEFIKNSFGFDIIHQDNIIGTNGITDKAIDENVCAVHPVHKLNVCKNHLIDQLAKKYNITNRKNILFFDDDTSLIIQAKNGGFNAVNSNEHLTVNLVMKNIAKYLGITQNGGYYRKYLKYKMKYVNAKTLSKHS